MLCIHGVDNQKMWWLKGWLSLPQQFSGGWQCYCWGSERAKITGQIASDNWQFLFLNCKGLPWPITNYWSQQSKVRLLNFVMLDIPLFCKVWILIIIRSSVKYKNSWIDNICNLHLLWHTRTVADINQECSMRKSTYQHYTNQHHTEQLPIIVHFPSESTALWLQV